MPAGRSGSLHVSVQPAGKRSGDREDGGRVQKEGEPQERQERDDGGSRGGEGRGEGDRGRKGGGRLRDEEGRMLKKEGVQASHA